MVIKPNNLHISLLLLIIYLLLRSGPPPEVQRPRSVPFKAALAVLQAVVGHHSAGRVRLLQIRAHEVFRRQRHLSGKYIGEDMIVHATFI